VSKRRRDTGSGTEALPFVVPSPAAGRMERAMVDTIALAAERGLVDDLDEALAQAAVELARSIDLANAGAGDPYAISQPAAQLRETVVLLRLDPASRGATASDPFDEFLAGMAGDGPGAEVRHGQDPRPA
jgi:hypothetical protein